MEQYQTFHSFHPSHYYEDVLPTPASTDSVFNKKNVCNETVSYLEEVRSLSNQRGVQFWFNPDVMRVLEKLLSLFVCERGVWYGERERK